MNEPTIERRVEMLEQSEITILRAIEYINERLDKRDDDVRELDYKYNKLYERLDKIARDLLGGEPMPRNKRDNLQVY